MVKNLEFQEQMKQLNKETSRVKENVVNLNETINLEKSLETTKALVNEADRVKNVAINTKTILADINEQFEDYTGLNKLDVSFLFLATALQVVRQYLLTNFPERKDDQQAAKETMGYKKKHSDRSHRYYHPSLEEIRANPVPFDANIGANGALSGGGALGHRVTALGHDPILGLVVGTSNIATSTLTNNRFQSYHITTMNKRDVFRNKAQTPLVFSKTKDRLLYEGVYGKKVISLSLVEEIKHLKSDLDSKNSLPLPFVSAVNPTLASELAKRGLDMSNVVSIGEQAGYSILINTLISMIHGLFYDESVMNRKLFDVKTRKILLYSNTIASISNLLVVGVGTALGNADAIKYLDVGGLLVTIYRIATDTDFIYNVKREFIEKEYRDLVMGKDFNTILI